MSAGHRLFVALWPTTAVREALVHAQEAWRDALDAAAAPHPRFVRADLLHLTLVFLGDVAAAAVADVESAVRRVAAQHAPFSVAPVRPGCFPGERSARVLWVGLDGEVDRLAPLQRELGSTLAPFAERADDRPFAPHLTLARYRDGRSLPPGTLARCASTFARRERVTWRVEDVALVESTLGREGPRYDLRLSTRLAADG